VWVTIAQSVWRLATHWTVRGSNAGGGEVEVLRTCPDRPGTHTMGKAAGRGVGHPPLSSVDAEERVQLYTPLCLHGLLPYTCNTLPLNTNTGHCNCFVNNKCELLITLRSALSPAVQPIYVAERRLDVTN
jgi:hypothetical protein